MPFAKILMREWNWRGIFNFFFAFLLRTKAPRSNAPTAHSNVGRKDKALVTNGILYDMAKMWEQNEYAKLLNTLHEQKAIPVTMDCSDIEVYLRMVNGHVEGREYDESVADGVVLRATFRIKLPSDDADPFEQALDQLLAGFPQARKEEIV